MNIIISWINQSRNSQPARRQQPTTFPTHETRIPSMQVNDYFFGRYKKSCWNLQMNGSINNLTIHHNIFVQSIDATSGTPYIKCKKMEDGTQEIAHAHIFRVTCLSTPDPGTISRELDSERMRFILWRRNSPILQDSFNAHTCNKTVLVNHPIESW